MNRSLTWFSGLATGALLVLGACGDRREQPPEQPPQAEAADEAAATVEIEPQPDEAAVPTAVRRNTPRRRNEALPVEPETPEVIELPSPPPVRPEPGDTLAEYRARGDRLFDRLDENRDGVADADEIHGRLGHGRRADWLIRSAPYDGRLGREDMRSAVTELFRRLDADGDGVVTAVEKAAGDDLLAD